MRYFISLCQGGSQSPYTGRTQLKMVYHTKTTIKVAHSESQSPYTGRTQLKKQEQQEARDTLVQVLRSQSPYTGRTQLKRPCKRGANWRVFCSHNPLTRGELNSSLLRVNSKL